MNPSSSKFDRSLTDVYRSPLRRDLNSVVVRGKTRVERIVIDEIGGRFARISDQVWRSLQSGDVDADIWNEARAAGWTRQRDARGRRRFHPLAIRIPIGSMDAVAARLSSFSGFLFSFPAVMGWVMLMAISLLLVVNRHDEVVVSLKSLPRFFYEAGPLLTVSVFIFTKLAHEMAHAVMCRRVGSRCGGFGLLLLCAVPCPYCDVTDIWRQGSTAKRIAVMLAGIYVELILASLASLVWCCTMDPAIRLAALNVMVVCGASTVIFNANPLMRYDGYYVLADLLRSTNLRQESRQSFAAVVTSRLAGNGYRVARRSDRRAMGLAMYHAASSVYRVVVYLAIAALAVSVSDMAGLRSLAILGLMILAMFAIARFGKRVRSVLRGGGRWEEVPRIRRNFVVAIVAAFILAALFTPLPRYRRAAGSIDAADATNVYFSSDGMVEHVFADFGDEVQQGQPLVNLSNDALSIEEAQLKGKFNVARLRNDLARRVTLGSSRGESHRERLDSVVQWPALQAAEDAAHVRLVSSRKRLAETKVTATQSGIVIPPATMNKMPRKPDHLFPSMGTLRDRQGDAVDPHVPWCRICSDGTLHAVLVLDARDREQIDVGSPVHLTLSRLPGEIRTSEVVSVSEIRRDDLSLTRHAAYRVLCRWPTLESDRLLPLLGAQCHGVFPLPKMTLADFLAKSLADWIHG